MKLTEPTTTITDYLLAAECIILGILLIRNTQSLPIRLWAGAFFVLALAAAAGGTYHGWIGSMGASTAQTVWKVTLYSIGIATLMMLSASFIAYMRHPWRNILLIVTILQFILFVIVLSRNNDFRYVIYNYVPAMIAILLMSIFQKNIWLVGAVLISFAGAAVQRSGLQWHKHFNFNDMYHLIQMIGMYFFYRGGKLLQPAG